MRAVAYYALSGVVVASAPHGSERGIVSRAGGGVCTSFFCEAAAVLRMVWRGRMRLARQSARPGSSLGAFE